MNESQPWLLAAMFTGFINYMANVDWFAVGGLLVSILSATVAILRYIEERKIRVIELEIKRKELKRLDVE